MNPWRYITGWALVRVTGAQPERLLGAMADRGLPFWDATAPEGFSLTLQTDGRTAARLPGLAAAVGCEAEIAESRGVGACVRKARKRLPLVILLAAALLLLAASLSRIWSIEVTGCETIPEGLVLQALSDCGVRIGARWVDMSQDQVRNAVILRLPEIRWMTVTMQGCRARVIVREKRGHIDPVPEGEYASVVADRAGFVTEVRAKRGTAVAQVNRAILPGETIIGGYATGRFGVQGPVRAIGYARARTWHEITAVLPVSVWEKEFSGEEKAGFSLLLGKKRINIFKGSSICPPDCDKIIKTYTLGRDGLFTLPLALEKTTIRHYEPRAMRAEELREELEALLMEELLSRIGEDGTVRTASFSASEHDGLLYVTLRAECEETIGETVPLTAEEIAGIRMKIPQTEEQTP